MLYISVNYRRKALLHLKQVRWIGELTGREGRTEEDTDTREQALAEAVSCTGDGCLSGTTALHNIYSSLKYETALILGPNAFHTHTLICKVLMLCV